ncbi:MAG: PIN domain-containing protein [Desulfobacterales bacterium]|nr:PIN domain-containing protein [Desulfobacterales bacterium]
MMMKNIFIDTNILVYATQTEFLVHREKAIAIFENLEMNYFISNQIINEYCNVVTNKNLYKNYLTMADAAFNIKKFVEDFSIVSIPSYKPHSFEEAVEKYKIERKKIFDFSIYYTMIQNDIYAIATANEKDFIIFPDIEIINPFKEVQM